MAAKSSERWVNIDELNLSLFISTSTDLQREEFVAALKEHCQNIASYSFELSEDGLKVRQCRFNNITPKPIKVSTD